MREAPLWRRTVSRPLGGGGGGGKREGEGGGEGGGWLWPFRDVLLLAPGFASNVARLMFAMAMSKLFLEARLCTMVWLRRGATNTSGPELTSGLFALKQQYHLPLTTRK